MRIFVAVLVFVLCGCFGCQTAPKERKATFIESEYQPYTKPGTAVINGQAFMVTMGGAVIKGAGRTVVLNPVTTYSSEWWHEGVLKQQPLVPPDMRAVPFMRQTIADGDGNFEFTGLPGGSYYLACQIVWTTPGGAAGGFARAQVSVRNGETAKAVLTQ